MSWVNNNANTVSAKPDDWLHDESEEGNGAEAAVEFDPIENLRRKFETLGQNEGLEKGMADGETKGFEFGFKSEAPRAFALGRILGAAKATIALKKNPNARLPLAVQQAELIASEHWVTNPHLVDDALEVVRQELSDVGVNLPEWRET